MRVFVTGATGLVGRALVPRLQRDGHAVVAWVRSPVRARSLLGAEVELVHADTAPDRLVAAIERSDAVVNLAGEPLMGGRWTAARRAVLEESRIAVTEQLVRAMAEAKRRRVSSFRGAPSAITATAAKNRSRKRPAAPTIFWPALPAVGERRTGRRAARRARGAAANRRGARSGRRRAGAAAAAVPVGCGRARHAGVRGEASVQIDGVIRYLRRLCSYFFVDGFLWIGEIFDTVIVVPSRSPSSCTALPMFARTSLKL